MRIHVRPRLFFAGLIGGLVCLSLVGASVRSKHLTDRFVRFHQLINIEAGFFPTAREVIDIVDKTSDDPSLIYVIVGGSSVFHGVGQHESLIWTRYLQEELGARYRVINFAQRAGSSSDFGNIAAEYLVRHSRRVIYVSDASVVAFVTALEPSLFKYIIFDAWQRNFLLPWPPRDRLLWWTSLTGTDQMRVAAIGAYLNAYLNFNELWNYVSFEFANLNWNWLLEGRSFRPRRRLSDPDLLPEQSAKLQYRDDFDVVMRIERAHILSPDDNRWPLFKQQIEIFAPPELRKVTLCVIGLDSPYFRDHLTPDERQGLLGTAQVHADLLTDLGVNRVIVPSADFAAEDYVDRVHLSVFGGRKLAVAVAPEVKKMASEFGYLK
jgi:hypothetical protein